MDFEQRVKLAIKEEVKIYKKAEIQKGLIINFPLRQKIPFIVKVAIWIIRIKGGILDTQFFDLKNKQK